MTLADLAWPVDGGKRLRVESLLRHVARTCDVDVLTLFAHPDPTLRTLPPDVDVRRWASVPRAERGLLRSGTALLARRVPWQVAVHDWRAAQAAVADWPTDHDVVVFGSMDHAVSLPRLACGAAAVVVDVDDVESVKLQRFLELPRSDGLPARDRVQRRVEVPLWERVQRRVLRTCDAALVCSELDRGRLAAFGPVERIEVVPNTYPAPACVPERRPDACTLLVVANYGTDQNLDAAAHAAHRVLPALRRRLPGLRLRMVGRGIERLSALQGIEGLDLVGPVDDVADELARATAVLLPVRFGSGTRLKILEAFAHAVPVVSTRAGAEGLDVVHGEHLLLAESPDDMAGAVGRLVDDPCLADRLACAGRALWQHSHTPAATRVAVEGLLERLLDRPT